MHGFVGATPPTRALPIAVAFLGALVCFAAWVVLMIRSQGHAPSAGRATWHAPDMVVGKHGVRSRVGARVTAWLLLLRSSDAGFPVPYLLPMPYSIALQGAEVRGSSRGEPDPTRARRAVPLRRAA